MAFPKDISRPPQQLPENYHGLCPYFDIDKAEESARDFRIPETTPAVFYSMVLNDAVELGVTSRVMADALMSVLKCLNWDFFESWFGRMAKIRMTGRLRSPDELLAKGTSKGNVCSSSVSHRSSVEVESTSTSSSLEGETSGSRRVVYKKRGRAQEEPIHKVMAERTVFSGASARSDIQDGPSTHFLQPQGRGLPKEVSAIGEVPPAYGVQIRNP
ncbi:hypothetical protein Cgig2_014193 [Carnegiea gigantea]|uniref:Uncharacterized protein n=1 Tax=Carnegiea gigantea TaxID=171969 RepID=A0A9Q1JYJ1_9CARY|nr:hypothetical protein Cgig2_014193 [Carnegiea gigantea]